MKKIISRVLIILIVFLILFDFVFASQYGCVYAAGPGKTIVDSISNLAGGLVSLVYTLLKALIVGLTYCVQVLTTVTASAQGLNTNDNFFSNAVNTVIDPITPIDIFFNKYKLTDINFFDFEGLDSSSFIYLFRMSVAKWFAIMKLIACAILLVILLYVGIRMGLSTLAEDKAKFKKMLVDWIVSLLLIFILQYIIIFTIYCNNAIVNALSVAFGDNDMSSNASKDIILIGINGIIEPGIISFAAVLVYIFIVFQTIIFLLAYVKRVIKVGFLIIISPLISITYSIDKMKDGKAQALDNWLKEFVYTILIQPFHCIIYLALVQTAVNLLNGGETLQLFDVTIFNSAEYNQLAAGVLAIMCLKFVNDGEQVVRKIFGFKDDGSTGMAAGAALGMAAIMNAKKIGKSTRSGVNNLKAKGKMFTNAIRKDTSKLSNRLKDTKIGSKIFDYGKNTSEKLKNSRLGRFADKGLNKTKELSDKHKNKMIKRKLKLADFKNKHKFVGKGLDIMKSKASLSTALGIMGAAMAYSAGNSNIMEATAIGTGIQKGTQEFFSSSSKSISKDNEELDKQGEIDDHYAQIESKMNENGTDFNEESKKALQAYSDNESLKYEKEKNKTKINKKQSEIYKYKKDNPDIAEDDEKLKTMQSELNSLKDEGDVIDSQISENNAIIKKYDKDGNLKEFGSQGFEEWKKQSEKKFNSQEERDKRFKSRRNSPNKQELDKIKNDIINQLRIAKKKSNHQDQDTELTVDEEASISSTAQLLMDNISLGTLNHKGFGTEAQKKIVTQQLGLNDDGTNYLFRGVTDFTRLSNQYEQCSVKSQMVQNINYVRSYDNSKMDIASEELEKRDYENFNNNLPSTEED